MSKIRSKCQKTASKQDLNNLAWFNHDFNLLFSHCIDHLQRNDFSILELWVNSVKRSIPHCFLRFVKFFELKHRCIMLLSLVPSLIWTHRVLRSEEHVVVTVVIKTDVNLQSKQTRLTGSRHWALLVIVIPPYNAKRFLSVRKKSFTGKLKLTYSEPFFSAEKHAGNSKILTAAQQHE